MLKPTKTLCTFGATYGGGILRVLMDGLPYLNRQPGVELTLGDIYERDDLKTGFSDVGVQVVGIGVKAPPYTSLRRGVGRQFDRLCAIPRYCRIAYRLRRAAHMVDVLYVHTYKELALAGLSGAPIVWHCHGLDSVPPLTALLAKSCSRVIAISDTVACSLRDAGVPPGRVVTVLNAIDLDGIFKADVTPIHPIPVRTDAPVALVPTAVIRAHKGVHTLLQAAQEVPCMDIWIAGDREDPVASDYVQQLVAMSRSPKLSGRVHFIGFRPDIYSVMRNVDIVCMPSICREGFGLAAAEAMAIGKIVVVSNRGALQEIVEHGTTGIVVDPENASEFASALRSVLENPQYARSLGEQAAASAAQRFSYIRWAESVAQVLRDASRC